MVFTFHASSLNEILLEGGRAPLDKPLLKGMFAYLKKRIVLKPIEIIFWVWFVFPLIILKNNKAVPLRSLLQTGLFFDLYFD